MSMSDEVALTFHVPETDWSMLRVELALKGLRLLLPPRRPDYATDTQAGVMYGYEICQRIWQRYCETVPEAARWLAEYPPLAVLWKEQP